LQSEILSHDPHTSMSLASLCITHLPFIAFLCSASAWCQTVGRSRIYSLPAERMHAHGACITQRSQRSNTESEHCIQWQRGGGYRLSINTARQSSSRPSPLCLFTATGKKVWLPWRHSCEWPAGLHFLLLLWFHFLTGLRGQRKKQQLDKEARRKLLLFPSFFYQQSLFLLFIVKDTSCKVGQINVL